MFGWKLQRFFEFSETWVGEEGKGGKGRSVKKPGSGRSGKNHFTAKQLGTLLLSPETLLVSRAFPSPPFARFTCGQAWIGKLSLWSGAGTP